MSLQLWTRTVVFHGETHEDGVEPEVDEELLDARGRVADGRQTTHGDGDDGDEQTQVARVVRRLEHARPRAHRLRAPTLQTQLHEELEHAREEVVEDVAVLDVAGDVCVRVDDGL